MVTQVAVNLDEDALNLWLAALRNAPGLQHTAVPNLLQLFPLAISLLAENLDLLGKIILIIESYLFAGAPLVLQVSSWFTSYHFTYTAVELCLEPHERCDKRIIRESDRN